MKNTKSTVQAMFLPPPFLALVWWVSGRHAAAPPNESADAGEHTPDASSPLRDAYEHLRITVLGSPLC